LAAAVAVEDDPGGLAATGRGCHLERVGDELGAHVCGHRVAQQATRTEVEHRRDVQPAFTARDVGDVADPGDIGRGWREPSTDQIR
jgi:hypothetical protein